MEVLGKDGGHKLSGSGRSIVVIMQAENLAVYDQFLGSYIQAV